VFTSNRKGHHDLYQKSASGAGAEELLLESVQSKFPNDWSADGRFLLYHSVDPQTGRDLWALRMDGDRTSQSFLKTPDERWGNVLAGRALGGLWSNEGGVRRWREIRKPS
jgi:Tol biopolymer transport system component